MMLTPKDIKDIKEDLLPVDDIFNNDSDILDRTKRIFASLDEVDKTILILYMELGSLRKVGEELGVSHTLIYKNITRIKEKFKKKL